jgi:hypothetical protein
MISILCWSKDRACQLNALLRSLRTYIPSSVVVLYTYSNDAFKAGYDLVRSEHPFVTFIKENDFYEDTIYSIEGMKSDNICLTTDDTFIFNSVDDLSFIKKNLNNQSVFSFRLGYNTVIQDHITQTYQGPLIPDKIEKNYLFWNPSKYVNYCNYGYPHALDMHLYSTSYLLPILKEIRFKTTNELEGILQKYNNRIKTLFSPKESVAVNIPLNNISGLTGVNQYRMSMEEMNTEFLKGKRLFYQLGNVIVGCHQDIEFRML